MANHEESNPLLTKQPEVNDEKKATNPDSTTTSPPAEEPAVIGGTTGGRQMDLWVSGKQLHILKTDTSHG